MPAALLPADVKDVIVTNLPAIDQHDEIVDHVAAGELTLRVPFHPDYLGTDMWGNSNNVVYSGPMVMGIADTAMYACLHGTFGRDIVAVIVSLTITFLQPARASDLTATARIIRRGGRLAFLETSLFSEGSPQPVAHVTATYAVRSKSTI